MKFISVFYPNYSDRQTCTNSVDPDQTRQNASSDQGLHWLQHVHVVLDVSVDSKTDLMKF